MKKKLVLFVLASLLLVMPAAVGQTSSASDLDRLSDIIHQTLQHELPAVVCRRGQPIEGSGSVLVESCFSGENVLKLSVIPYASKELARSRFREFAALKRDREATADIGEEGYAWGFRKSNIAFREDRYNTYVSIDDSEVVDADKICKQFAKAVTKGLKNL